MSKQLKTVLRLVCMVCILALCLGAFTGCMDYASEEDFEALKNALTSQIESLKNANDAAQQEIEFLKNSNDAAQQEIESLKNSNEAAQQQIDSLLSTNEAAQKEIDSLKAGIEAAQKELEAMESSNEASQQEIESLKSSIEAAQQQIEALQGTIDDAQQEIDRLQEQIKELEGDDDIQKIKIYIDQGHNPTGSGWNTGAEGNGLYEQDLTYTIGILLAELLEEDGRFEICLSRPTADTVLGTDNSSSLKARVQGAEDFGADYFISLHINSYTSDSVTGIEMLYYADETAYAFGQYLLESIVESTGLRTRGMKKRTDLYVLRYTSMPAVLVEMGFITNSGDATLLSEQPELFAQGLYDGILAYFELT